MIPQVTDWDDAYANGSNIARGDRWPQAMAVDFTHVAIGIARTLPAYDGAPGEEALLASLMAGRRVVAVAGTHGKTTTTSLTALLVERAGRRVGLAGNIGPTLLDTLASALLANGVRLVGRSFKYHRPRGTVAAGAEEPNALVELRSGARREPNTRATVAELYDGLEAASQNRWPSLNYDIGSFNSLLSPFLGAGFYYKTFMWPAALWEKLYEPVIRRAAGLGRAPELPDPDRYEQAYGFAEVVVVGGGIAGVSAAGASPSPLKAATASPTSRT